MSTKLLKKYISQILRESDDYGGFDMSGNAGDSPFGASFGSEKDLYNVFVKPFTDVAATAAGKGKELSQKAQTLAKVGFEAIATSFLPFLQDDYEKIFAKEEEAITKLKSQYKDIYDSTWTAFRDHDVLTAAFMYAPAAMITAKIAQQAPIQTIKVLNVLTGGNLDGFLNKVLKVLKPDTKKPLDRDSGEGMPMEGIIRELHKKQIDIGKVLTQKKLKQAIDDNPKTTKMRTDAKEVLESSLNQVLKRANAISGATSIQDLESKLGTKLKGTDKLQQVPANERQALEQNLIKGLKKSAISMYIKGLTQQVDKAEKQGVPAEHPYVVLIQGVISKLKSLS